MSGILLCLVMILFRAHKAHSWMVFVSAGLVLLLGLLITIKLMLFERGLEERLARLATLRAAHEELNALEIHIGEQFEGRARQVGSLLENVTPINPQVFQAFIDELEAGSKAKAESKEPKPDSRLARVLRDDYPL
jgi:hypothetical protein